MRRRLANYEEALSAYRSKERVWVRWAQANGFSVPAWLEERVAPEIHLVGRFRDVLADQGIPWRDAVETLLPVLDAARKSGAAAYAPEDGHPLEEGYLAYANAALELVTPAGPP